MILELEQFYIDTLKPKYNINPLAGSRLGSRHSPDTLTKISEALSGNNHPMYGKTHSSDTLAKMSEAQKSVDRRGENHPMFGRTHSAETKALMSEAKKGEDNPMFGKTGENHHFFGQTHSEDTLAKISGKNNHFFFGKTHTPETIAKISVAQGTAIYVYGSDGSLVNTFSSARNAALHFKCSINTILKYARNSKIFKEKWILSMSIIKGKGALPGFI